MFPIFYLFTYLFWQYWGLKLFEANTIQLRYVSRPLGCLRNVSITHINTPHSILLTITNDARAGARQEEMVANDKRSKSLSRDGHNDEICGALGKHSCERPKHRLQLFEPHLSWSCSCCCGQIRSKSKHNRRGLGRHEPYLCSWPSSIHKIGPRKAFFLTIHALPELQPKEKAWNVNFSSLPLR